MGTVEVGGQLPRLALIGLIGKKRVGKDTVAGILSTEYGHVRIAFADPLKAALFHLDPYVQVVSDDAGTVHMQRLSEAVQEMGWEALKDRAPEVRRLMQNYGEGIRAFDPDFWTRVALSRANDVVPNGYPVVFSDVRYRNEADAIRAAGGTLIRVTRNTGLPDDSHASENDLTGYTADVSILNNGTVDDLRTTITALFG